MSESLLLETNGAIAILGATRSISKAINKKFLDNFYGDIREYILDGQGLIRLGDLFLNSKTTSMILIQVTFTTQAIAMVDISMIYLVIRDTNATS